MFRQRHCICIRFHARCIGMRTVSSELKLLSFSVPICAVEHPHKEEH